MLNENYQMFLSGSSAGELNLELYTCKASDLPGRHIPSPIQIFFYDYI